MAETEEIKKRYERRKLLSKKKIYSYFDKGNFFIIQERERGILSLLEKYDFSDLEHRIILDIGCGSGSWLRDFVQWGAKPDNCYGIDLLEDRVAKARQINPNMHVDSANAERLEFRAKQFDVVILATCLTSVLDQAMKRCIAREAIRVLAVDGMILWYDFHYDNPWNPDVKGIKKEEIIELFADCEYDFKSVTLAPPIVRFLAPISWLACELLSMIPFLKTHYLVVIRKKVNK